MPAKRTLDYLIYVLIRLLISIVQSLRIETCHAMSRRLAWLCYDVIGLRREVIDENLSRAFPGLSPAARQRLARRSWEHIFLMVAEIAHTERKIHETNWRQYVSLRNARPLVAAMLHERPTVLVSGHVGNFELAGYMTGLFGLRTFTIARPLDNPFLDRFLNRFRQARGQRTVPKEGSAGQIDQLLSSGGILVVLGDQAAGPKGCWVDFFDRKASTHKAIALFSLTHDAPLVVCCSLRNGEPMRFEIGSEAIADPLNAGAETAGVRELTQWYTDRLEDIVRRVPNQYWWVHRRWKDYGPYRRGRTRRRRRRKAAA